MAISTEYTAASNTQNGAVQVKVGRLTMAGSITTANVVVMEVGFTPRYIRWQSLTARISGEWFEGMAADSAFKSIAAGDRSIITSNAITVCDEDGNASTTGRCFSVSLDGTSLLAAANDVCAWIAIG